MVIAMIIIPCLQLNIFIQSITIVLSSKGNKNFKVSNFLIQKSRYLGFNKAEYTSISIFTHKL